MARVTSQGDGEGRFEFNYQTPRLPKLGPIALGIALLAFGLGYWWFVQRIEVGADELCVLVRKVGRAIPSAGDGQIVLYPELLKELGEPAASTRYQGIMLEPLGQGRYFRDPFFWRREIIPVTIIPQDEIGILIRKFGKPLGAGDIGGRTLATAPGERGPIREVLRPGRHNVNTLAYAVVRVKPVSIAAGQVGIQTLLSGDAPTNPNTYVVERGKRGVQPDVLPPGLYYNNPFERSIDVIDVRSHTLDLRGEESIQFPSADSFAILLEATVEYAIREDMAPYVLVAIGEHQHVVNRIILPYMNSLSRIEGSKLYARDFISGERRMAFQNRVLQQLREQCYAQGIDIRAALIRRIVAPQEIAGPISDRQVAEQEVKQYESEIKVAQSEALLVEQEEMQKQNRALGEARRETVAIVKESEQQMSVALTEAAQRLEVAKLKLQAATETAAAIQSRGKAEADVRLMNFQARASPLREAISAFGSGDAYAQYHFYQKLAPAMKSVLDSTAGPLTDVFRQLTRDIGVRPVTPVSSAAPAAPEEGQ